MSSVKFFYGPCITSYVLILIFVNFLHIKFSLADTANLDTLEFTQVLIRHGDRTPEYTYPTDPYQEESFWAEGWGQITETGKMQEYELGKYLRRRYGTFLSEKYIADEIYVLSSDIDRTIMSAEICLAGLFPANKSDTNWNPDINWQPVPLHTIAAEQDNIIRMKRECPRFDELFDDFMYNSEMMKKINSDNAALFKDLSEKSGVNITTIMEIDKFYSPLYIEHLRNLTLPDWTAPLFTDDHFQYLRSLSFAARTFTPELQRLRVGELIKYLAHNINKTLSSPNGDSKTKFVLLAGHDITLGDLMNTLGVYNMKIPFYGSALMMELHKDNNNNNTGDKYYLNLFLKNDTTRDAFQLFIPGCDFNCPIETILEKLYPIIPNNLDEECQTLAQLENFSWIAILAIGLASAVLVGLFLGSSLILCKRIRESKQMRGEYQEIRNFY